MGLAFTSWFQAYRGFASSNTARDPFVAACPLGIFLVSAQGRSDPNLSQANIPKFAKKASAHPLWLD